MTNILAQITVSLMLITNWSGHNFNGKELGYVATNHVAQIYYQGVTNEYVMKTVASEIAVWRQAPVLQAWPWAATNYHYSPGMTFTNWGVIKVDSK